MSAMRSDDERALEAALAPAQTQADRIARVAGFIAGRARAIGLDSVVVSGGAAVVLATAEDFATLDVDLVTPDGDALDAVLRPLGFERRNPHQHIWIHPRLHLAVQVPGSFLPPHSAVETVEAPTGDEVEIWSTTDLVLDRLAQAVFGGARERLGQALALREAAGDDFELDRAAQRAADEGPLMTQALEAFVRLVDELTADGPQADEADEDPLARFWATADRLGLGR